MAKEGQGKVDSMEQKENRISFKIAGKYYTLWGKGEEPEEKSEYIAKVAGAIRPGDYVTFSYVEKDNPNGSAPYKNITAIKKAQPPTTTTTTQSPVSYDPGRDKSIRRQVAFKGAVDVAVALINKGEKIQADQFVSSMTDIFEEIICSENEIMKQVSELTKPKKDAELSVKEENVEY